MCDPWPHKIKYNPYAIHKCTMKISSIEYWWKHATCPAFLIRTWATSYASPVLPLTLQHCSTAALQGDCSAVVQPAAEPHAAALDILFLWRFWNERTRALPRERSEDLRSLRALHTKNKYLLQWLLQLLHGLQSCSWPPDPQLLHTFPPTLI